jgi:predicted nucleic acid-binding protein
LLDTGVLVALYARDDARHDAVTRWFEDFHGELHTVQPVLTEAAFFLPVRMRSAVARLAGQGTLTVHAIDDGAHRRMAELFDKYRDQDPDWADIALLWLAESAGIRRIATLDVTDFTVYRLHGRTRFQLELLR